ncbi:Anaphase-promoting complex, cyclosome, subunit 3/TPR repeat, putative [Trypanosoma equiperdum]|uniref:Uncharacterized protein n=3 Tax=Trypanozoon TaxID=39700 RepID=Q389U4_TRYB2|nr:hypothetical protein, conserved [Trypanosoma brucei gambiense DAL972]XP_823254.1 hypothetical protein, conserved [Trypanosoma brucei brucei TREU927]EAN78426.1 hypothetical protein, conserved [Trypanosoma brucei brucei TREU927]CBH16162.1 hypothetical protein, conserved [Trypanosoma brucei gambiense DAL972]SCU72123.1 Anaphase-promoting complex, cyclosome, subunit 3/TPR repeat, putative [Trypanosoma equiperdum]|eukprot:XP_011778426.1 hypothetical protein, conserved [Trypanosoma brucei gambiense DAL972]
MTAQRDHRKSLVVQGLKEAIQESLASYIYPNAIFCAERLYSLEPTYESLHTLAHCYVTSGDAGTAYRLLQTHCPSLSPSNSVSSSNVSISGGPDATAKWNCQYLFGVTCAMSQRYAEGERVLDELDRHRTCSDVQYWLGVCRQRGRHGNGDDAFARSAILDPLNFVAYEEYLKITGTPKEEMCHMYSSAKAPTGAEETPRRPAPVGVTCSRSKTPSTSSKQSRRDFVRQYLSPFAAIAFMQRMYMCKDVQAALQQEGFPEQSTSWAVGALAMAYFHDGDVENAVKEFARLRQIAPWRLADPLLVHYSTALWQRKDTGALGSLSQTLINEMPVSPVTLCVAANAYSLLKESKEALCMLDRAVQLDSEFAYAHTLRGYELLHLDRKHDAYESFQNAVLIDSNHYNAYAGLGELYFRSENIPQAQYYFKQAIQINPLPSIMNRYAATYHRRDTSKENLSEALRIYDSAIKRHPTNLGARHQRAEVLIRLRRYPEAREALLEMTKACPDEAMLYVTLAKCVHFMGMPGKAVQYYHTAMDLDPRRAGFIKSCLQRISMEEPE